MARRKKLYIRKFLNKVGHHTTGHVLAIVDGNSFTFNLADCDRQIKLDFNGYDSAARKNALFKVTVLLDTVTAFKKAMEAQFKSSRPEDD